MANTAQTTMTTPSRLRNTALRQIRMVPPPNFVMAGSMRSIAIKRGGYPRQFSSSQDIQFGAGGNPEAFNRHESK
jgi:hypothetical protein